MCCSNTFSKRVVNFLWKHWLHLTIQRSVKDFERPARGAITEEPFDILLCRVMHGLVKELHVFCQNLMHKHQVAQAHRHPLALGNRAKAELDSLFRGAVAFGHSFFATCLKSARFST